VPESFEESLEERKQFVSEKLRRHIEEVCDFYVFRKSLLEREHGTDRDCSDPFTIREV